MLEQRPFRRGAGIAESNRRRVPWRTVALVVGDAASFLIFSALGRSSHHEASGLGALGAVVGTALPFAFGWFVVAPLIGAFRLSATKTLGMMLQRTELAWLCAWPVAMLARLAVDPRHSIPMPFPIIVLAFNALFLGIWRSTFSLVERQRARARQ